MTSLSDLRETTNHLNGDQGIAFLQSEYERLRDERQTEASEIYEASGQTVELPPFDATTSEWGPEWVEPPELATAAAVADDTTTTDDSGTTDDSAATTTDDSGTTSPPV